MNKFFQKLLWNPRIRRDNFWRIAQRMFTTKAKGQGLAVVKRLIDAMNGSITFESQVGNGTTFTVKIPINQART
jgi:two-component system nitrogen regulation sensor histidine kinase NtrY